MSEKYGGSIKELTGMRLVPEKEEKLKTQKSFWPGSPCNRPPTEHRHYSRTELLTIIQVGNLCWMVPRLPETEGVFMGKLARVLRGGRVFGVWFVSSRIDKGGGFWASLPDLGGH